MPRSAKNVFRKCQHSFFEDIRRQQADKEEKIDQEETEDDEEDEEDWTCCGQFKSQLKNNSAKDDPFFTMPVDQKLKLIADEVKQNELSYKSKIETRDSEIKILEMQLDEVLKRNSELEKELSALKISKMKDQKMLDMFDQFTSDWIETKGKKRMF
jgi:predicted RNase H-like nuclease (RuvC/YqgF family)